jgi:regulator of sigma E protease
MALLYFLGTLVILNIVYTIGFLSAKILTNACHQHYLIGYKPSLITFSIRKIKISLGLYIPIIGLSRIYRFENLEKEQSLYPWQFHDVSILKRLFVTYSGVLSLFVFGSIMSMLGVYTSRERYIPKEEVNKYGVYPSEEARALGFQTGDKIIALNGRDYDDFFDLNQPDVIESPETYYTILRGEKTLTIRLHDFAPVAFSITGLFLELNVPFWVNNVVAGSPAANAEIYKGDKIVKVDGNRIVKTREMNEYLQLDTDGQVLLEIERGEGVAFRRLEKVVQLKSNRKLGISIDERIHYKIREYSVLRSICLGAQRFCSSVGSWIKAIVTIVGMNLPGAESRLSGPMNISSAIEGESLNWFIYVICKYASLTIFMNFLPSPKSALLEIIPLGYEALTRKHFAYKSFRIVQLISIWLFVLLIIWQFVIDLAKLF